MDKYGTMETLGNQIDTLGNLLGAMKLPMPAAMNLEMLKPALEGVVKKLREVYTLETGEDPWHEQDGDSDEQR